MDQFNMHTYAYDIHTCNNLSFFLPIGLACICDLTWITNHSKQNLQLFIKVFIVGQHLVAGFPRFGIIPKVYMNSLLRVVEKEFFFRLLVEIIKPSIWVVFLPSEGLLNQ